MAGSTETFSGSQLGLNPRTLLSFVDSVSGRISDRLAESIWPIG
jgi:hypothetical protein